MAVVTVGKSGADYTTWAAAETNSNASDSVECIDGEEYVEAFTVSGATGRTFTVQSGNRHDGTIGSGARIRDNGTGGNAVIEVADANTTIEYLEIVVDHTGASDEGIRHDAGTETVNVQYCIIRATSQQSEQDGVYLNATSGGAGNIVCNIIACWFSTFGRGGQHPQNASGNRAMDINMDSCLTVNCGDDANGGGLVVRGDANAVNATCYNCAWLDNTGSGGSDVEDPFGEGTYAGSNNIASDTTVESKFTASYDSVNLTDVTTDAGEVYLVTDETLTAPDWNLVDTGSGTRVAVGNGTDRNPPVTQDMVAYALAADGPDDIGPLQIQAAVAPSVPLIAMLRRQTTILRGRNVHR